MYYAVNSERQIVRCTPGRIRSSVLVAVPVDLEDSLALVNHANSGLHPGVPHVEFPPIDAYRAKCREIIGDWPFDGDPDGLLPEDATDAQILEWLDQMVDNLKAARNADRAYVARIDADRQRLTTTEASLRAHYENAISDLNAANRELDSLRAMNGPVPFERGIVAYRGYDNAVVQWPSPANTGFDVGTEVLVVPVNGTRTSGEKVGDHQYINAG